MNPWRLNIKMRMHRAIRWISAPWRVVRILAVFVLAITGVWLMLPPEPQHILPIRNAQSAAFSADGGKMLVVSPESWLGSPRSATSTRFTLWDIKAGTKVSTVVNFSGVWAWSSSGRYLAIIHDRSLSLLETETFSTLKTVNVWENPPNRWTSWGTLSDSMAKTIEELSQFKPRLFPQAVEFATDDLVIVKCQPEEGWRIFLRQRGVTTVCQRRYRTPNLEGGEAELWTWLTANQRETRSRILIAREWQKDKTDAGWRLIDLETGRTKVWIVEPSQKVRSAGLSADETLLATGLSTGSSGGELGRYSRLPDDLGVQLYDADTGGLLRSFPDEFNPEFSHEGAYLLTQATHDGDDASPLIVRLRNTNNGSLLSELDLSRVALSAGQTIEDRTETDKAIAKGLKPVAVPPPRLANCKVLTTRNAAVPFVAIRQNTGTQISPLNRLRRLSAESDLIDLTQGALLGRLPGCHALSPNLDLAVELREKDVALWKLHGSRWPLSLRHIGVSLLVVLAALLLEMLVWLWFSWLLSIRAIEVKNGMSQ